MYIYMYIYIYIYFFLGGEDPPLETTATPTCQQKLT